MTAIVNTRGFWRLSQNRDRRNRFVYNPKNRGIYAPISLVNKLGEIVPLKKTGYPIQQPKSLKMVKQFMVF